MLASRNLTVPSQNGRPRSATAGSDKDPKSAPPLSRPPHLRSRSYLSGLSPTDPKPRNAMTMPIEGSGSRATMDNVKDVVRQEKEDESSANSILPRIHLPGQKHRQSHDLRSRKDGSHSHSHHLHLHRTHSHRHTKSEMPRGSTTTAKSTDDTSLSKFPNRSSTNNSIDDTLLNPAQANSKSMLNRVATNLSSRAANFQGGAPGTASQYKPHPHRHHHHRHHHHQHSTSEFRHAGFSAAHIAAHGIGGRPELRRRATSPRALPFQRTNKFGDAAQAQYGLAGGLDGLSPTTSSDQPQKQKHLSEVEALLLKAEKSAREAELNASEADVQRLTTQLAESNVELQNTLASTNLTASNLMRRLDDAHDTLRSTASALIDTISSFQNLCQQSETLQYNFDRRSAELDSSTRETLDRHREALLDARGEKTGKLEQRMRTSSTKAEKMSARLENCRIIVRNYTERQNTKRRAWKGVLLGSLWGVGVILFGLLLGFGLWWWKSYSDIVRYDIHEALAIALDAKGLGSAQRQVQDVARRKLRVNNEEVNANETKRVRVLEGVPDDVKKVLEEIRVRHEGRSPTGVGQRHIYVEPTRMPDVEEGEEEKRLGKLFEKLEL